MLSLLYLQKKFSPERKDLLQVIKTSPSIMPSFKYSVSNITLSISLFQNGLEITFYFTREGIVIEVERH